MAMTSLLLLLQWGHRHRCAGEEADVLPAEGACFGGLCDFEGAGGADADVAAGRELGIGSVVVADEARRLAIILIILLWWFGGGAGHGLHGAIADDAAGECADGAGEKDDLILPHACVFEIELGRKAETHAERPCCVAGAANDDVREVGDGLPGQTLGVIDGDGDIVDGERGAAEALLGPEGEVIGFAVKVDKGLALSIAAVDARAGLGVEGDIRAE